MAGPAGGGGEGRSEAEDASDSTGAGNPQSEPATWRAGESRSETPRQDSGKAGRRFAIVPTATPCGWPFDHRTPSVQPRAASTWRIVPGQPGRAPARLARQDSTRAAARQKPALPATCPTLDEKGGLNIAADTMR